MLAENFLKDILPYLRIKQEQAQLAIKLHRRLITPGKRISDKENQRRFEIMERIKKLNSAIEPVQFALEMDTSPQLEFGPEDWKW